MEALVLTLGIIAAIALIGLIAYWAWLKEKKRR